MTETNNTYFMCADQHKFKHIEMDQFEFIQFSTPVLGDKYASELNLKNKPRQNGLIIDVDDGIINVLHFPMVKSEK